MSKKVIENEKVNENIKVYENDNENQNTEAETLIDILSKNNMIACTTNGYSMFPFLKHRRDVVVILKSDGNVKKYDVALYVDRAGRYVLHRVIKVNGGSAFIRGDNCIGGEKVEISRIIGVLDEFTRKGKEGTVRDKGYICYSKAIVFFHPLVCVKLAIESFYAKIKLNLAKAAARLRKK